jgi:hypothetical protein
LSWPNVAQANARQADAYEKLSHCDLFSFGSSWNPETIT